MGIDVIKADVGIMTQHVDTFIFELSRLTEKINNFYTELPKYNDIQELIDNNKVLQTINVLNDCMYISKEIHTNYDIYIKNRCINDILENALDKRDLNIITLDLNNKLDSIYNR